MATLINVRDRLLTGTSRPAWAIGAFAGMAALLAALGLYGVLAHTVSQRRREIGIRMALGAPVSTVLTSVLSGAIALVSVGLALGLAGAAGADSADEDVAVRCQPLDPARSAGGGARCSPSACSPALVPANRAARVNPITVFHEE